MVRLDGDATSILMLKLYHKLTGKTKTKGTKRDI